MDTNNVYTKNELGYLLDVDFGDIDGLYDPNINDYFIDVEFKKSLLQEAKYFVIGRKGTGKSALYNWIDRNKVTDGIMVSNKSFSDFPFSKLLQLSDDNFTKPNQYQSIWKNIILTEYALLLCQDQSNPIDDSLSELRNYINYVFGNDLIDLHKAVTRKSEKSEYGISIKGLTNQYGEKKEIEYYDQCKDITIVNNRLNNVLLDYLTRHETKTYIVQFDQLDDNYTSYVNNDDYIQCVISLFKTIYQLNQSYRSKNINVKTVAYLRSDIYNKFYKHDPESARWDQYILKLNWSIINRNDWFNSNLLKLINARIHISLPQIKTQSPFHTIFNKHKLHLRIGRNKNGDVFKYIIHRTFQRPRDLIQFCIKIQDECKTSSSLSKESIRNAEKEYSLWLLGEVENEIAPIIKDTEALYELLRLIGRGVYTVSFFKEKYTRFQSCFVDIDIERMLKLLYEFGIISNVRQKNGKIVEQFSIIRNDRSVFNRDLNIVTHPGFYEGLHTSKFLNR